jgi:hypothetical protein
MKKSILIVLTVLVSTLAQAQFIKETSIDASIGLGYTFPYDDVNINGSGFYLQGDYVLTLASWIDIRPYAGVILTKADKLENAQDFPDYQTTTNAFFIGGKTRIMAPIPWVSPYIEIGVGASVGAFRTFTPFTDIDKSGLLVHIPWSIGLEIGRHHNFNIAFSYLEHPSAEQVSGAFAVGYSFPLEGN